MPWSEEEMEEAQICSDCPGGLMCCFNVHLQYDEDEYVDYSCEVCGDYH